MPVGDSRTGPADLLQKIRGFFRSLLEDLRDGHSPVVVLDRFKTYCSDTSGNCFCCLELPCGKDKISFGKVNHAYRIGVLFKVLSVVQHLLQENKHASKRDIYYMDPSFFLEQTNVDRAINDICILLKCSRHHLNVVSVGKGLVMGWLRFTESGRKVLCIQNLDTAYPIPVSVEQVKDLGSAAEYILVVEKEAVFQRLANDRFCEANRAIVITGRGYPDVPTRRFLHYLVEQLHLPVYCLTDSDPHGFEIIMVYRFGSMQLAYDARFMRLPDIHWLGILPSDLEEYNIPDRCLLKLTPGGKILCLSYLSISERTCSTPDKKKAKAMLSRCYLHQNTPRWRSELEKMMHKGVKVETEAMSMTSLSFLSKEYIPSKIRKKAYI